MLLQVHLIFLSVTAMKCHGCAFVAEGAFLPFPVFEEVFLLHRNIFVASDRMPFLYKIYKCHFITPRACCTGLQALLSSRSYCFYGQNSSTLYASATAISILMCFSTGSPFRYFSAAIYTCLTNSAGGTTTQAT